MSFTLEYLKGTANTAVFDFESTSTERDAGLVSVGCFVFNRFSVEETEAVMKLEPFSFYEVFDLLSQFFLGFDINKGTGKWWREKNADQIKEILKTEKVDLKEGLLAFGEFLKKYEIDVIFCRHPHADWVWLDNACKLLGIKNPVRYNQVFDISTAVLQVTGEKKGYVKTNREWAHHNALADCQRDALQLAMITDPNFKLLPEHIPGK